MKNFIIFILASFRDHYKYSGNEAMYIWSRVIMALFPGFLWNRNITKAGKSLVLYLTSATTRVEEDFSAHR